MFPHQRYQFQPTQCPNTGTQHRPTGNGSTSGLTSPQCQTSVHHYFSQEGFSFCCLLLFSLDGSPKPAMAMLLTSHRLIALTFMHRAGSLVPWDSQIHNNSSDCPRLPAPSNNHLFPWPHLQRPTSSSLISQSSLSTFWQPCLPFTSTHPHLHNPSCSSHWHH